MDLLLLKKY